VLLAKTLTSSTFKLALVAIGIFGVIMSVIFSYVYLSTSSYVRSRSDRTIMTEYLSLQDAYERSGRGGLIALIQQRMARQEFCKQRVFPRRFFTGFSGWQPQGMATDGDGGEWMDRVSRAGAVAERDKPAAAARKAGDIPKRRSSSGGKGYQ
jgi:hypothetical protein